MPEVSKLYTDELIYGESRVFNAFMTGAARAILSFCLDAVTDGDRERAHSYAKSWVEAYEKRETWEQAQRAASKLERSEFEVKP